MEKSDYQELKKQLLSTKKNGYDILTEADRTAMEDYCAGYKRFLDVSKTERLCAAETVRMAEERGYRPYTPGMAVKPGDKVYVRNRGKAVMLAHIGRAPLSGPEQEAPQRGGSRRDAESAAGQLPHRRGRGVRPGEAGRDEAASREIRHYGGRSQLRGAVGGSGGESL